jgi:dimethylhistidine N-methyltransferase
VSTFVDELVAGLNLQRRAVAPKWLYDTTGSRIFEEICALPEYYPTRTEQRLLEHRAADIAQRIGPQAEIVEFGAGSTRKVRTLLQAFEQPASYVPIDISGDFLGSSVYSLRSQFPELAVRAVHADFTVGLKLPAQLGQGKRLGFFPGSSIGNFKPDVAQELLRSFHVHLNAGALLVGVDLVKDPSLLHAAYNDSLGVTAAFNMNLWARANREARADFNVDNWMHAAFYNSPLRRVEMHLISRCPQRVMVAGRAFDFEEGESVHTENSYKYTVEGFQSLARGAGWTPRGVWTDAQRRFSLHLLWSLGDPDACASEEIQVQDIRLPHATGAGHHPL